MDNSGFSRNRPPNDPLGVNKIGKNIRKSPIHQTNFTNHRNSNLNQNQNQNQNQQQQPQPQVYNISKNDFRSIVQQLTGSPSHSSNSNPHPVPPHNPPKPPSTRLHKIRPPPLSPIARPPPPPLIPFNNNIPNIQNNQTAVANQTGSISPFFGQPGQFPNLPNTAESPISAYMRYLQNSMIDSSPRQLLMQQQQQQQLPSGAPGILPLPPAPAFPSPRGSGTLTLLPSPALPSPSSFLNLLSPRSPFPLLSPGFQYPLTPNFSFPPLSPAPGILGPGPQPPPLSPSAFLPSSPSGFFSISSPRWRS